MNPRLAAAAMALTLGACTATPTSPTPRPSTLVSSSPGPAGPTAGRGLQGRIAYSTPQGDIWVMNADGTGRRRVTHAGGVDFDPSFSPDGTRIVFRTSRGTYAPDPSGTGVEGIFVVNADGTGEHPIQPRAGGLFPDWSPAGDRIALSTLESTGGETIVTVNDRGRHLLDTHAAGECSEWSPDGGQIMYCHQTHTAYGFDLYVMNADGSNQRRLTTAVGNDNPGAWSPDGRRIAFSSERDGNYEVFVMDSDGSDLRRLTRGPRPEAAMGWLPDGRILFCRFVDEGPLPDWYLMNDDGSNVQALPQLKGAGAPLDWFPG